MCALSLQVYWPKKTGDRKRPRNSVDSRFLIFLACTMESRYVNQFNAPAPAQLCPVSLHFACYVESLQIRITDGQPKLKSYTKALQTVLGRARGSVEHGMLLRGKVTWAGTIARRADTHPRLYETMRGLCQ